MAVVYHVLDRCFLEFLLFKCEHCNLFPYQIDVLLESCKVVLDLERELLLEQVAETFNLVIRQALTFHQHFGRDKDQRHFEPVCGND